MGVLPYIGCVGMCGAKGYLFIYLFIYLIAFTMITILKKTREKYAVAIWPVTGQGFQNTKWPAVLYSQ